jgi:hypothetical protein
MERVSVLREIVNTERVYLSSLQVIQDLYAAPLMKIAATADELLSRSEVMALFGEIPTLMSVNSVLLRDLDDRLNTKKHASRQFHCVGDVFHRMAPFLKSYASFCGSYEDAVSMLTKKAASFPELQRFMENASRDPRSKNQSLESLLIRPVQRLPKYPLLLRELVKDTCPNHPDFAMLTQAEDRMREATAYVNERVREQETRRKLVAISEGMQNVPPNFVAPHRYLVKEGVVRKVSDRAIQARHLFLCNDMFLYAKGTPGSLRVAGSVSLSIVPVPWARSIPDVDAKARHLFQIVIPGRTYTLIADSDADRDSWVSAIEGVITKLVSVSAEMRSKPRAEITFLKAQKGFGMFTMQPQQYDPDYQRGLEADEELLRTRKDCYRVRTLFERTPEMETDLWFPAGVDIIFIPDEGANAAWWLGQYLGKRGWFPTNYVQTAQPKVASPASTARPLSPPNGALPPSTASSSAPVAITSRNTAPAGAAAAEPVSTSSTVRHAPPPSNKSPNSNPPASNSSPASQQFFPASSSSSSPNSFASPNTPRSTPASSTSAAARPVSIRAPAPVGLAAARQSVSLRPVLIPDAAVGNSPADGDSSVPPWMRELQERKLKRQNSSDALPVSSSPSPAPASSSSSSSSSAAKSSSSEAPSSSATSAPTSSAPPVVSEETKPQLVTAPAPAPAPQPEQQVPPSQELTAPTTQKPVAVKAVPANEHPISSSSLSSSSSSSSSSSAPSADRGQIERVEFSSVAARIARFNTMKQ